MISEKRKPVWKNRQAAGCRSRRRDVDANKGSAGTISRTRLNGICNGLIRRYINSYGCIPQEVVQLDSTAVGQRGFNRLNETSSELKRWLAVCTADHGIRHLENDCPHDLTIHGRLGSSARIDTFELARTSFIVVCRTDRWIPLTYPISIDCIVSEFEDQWWSDGIKFNTWL